jgi:4-amino-4-deoxy-L-arabinose transferase-like glycosyltransferase
MSQKSKWREMMLVLGALVCAAILKFELVQSNVVPFNSDEAVVALMARHILQGERPIFFYGQAYMGSLDAWLITAGFWVFGQQVWVIRLVQGLLYLGTLWTTMKIGELALGSRKTGIMAAWLLAVPVVTVTLYTTATLGGYGEALLIGNLLLMLTLQIERDLRHDGHKKNWFWLLWGILAGGGLWVFGLTLVYSLPSGLYLLRLLWMKYLRAKDVRRPRELVQPQVLMLLGGLIGAIPWLVYASQEGLNILIAELTAGGIGGIEGGNWLVRAGRHLFSLVVFGGSAIFGLRPSWEIRWLAYPLLPFVLAFWMVVLSSIPGRLRRNQPEREGAWLLVGVMLTLAGGFIFTSFGVDPSGRYFVPLAVPLSLFAADLILKLGDRRQIAGWGLIALVVVFNLWGTLQSALKYPPGITTQFDPVAQVDHRDMGELIDFLYRQDEMRGYTNYWVAYPLAFLSNEELIFVPRLPYHEDLRYTPRDDRYPPYSEAVAVAEKVAYITTNHPDLNEYIQAGFSSLDVSWQEIQIGDYTVFYDLSRPVRPQEIGLGE